FSTPHGGGGPGAGPVAVRARLADYLPVPRLVRRDGVLAWTDDAPKSVGRLRAFYGNFGILVRAYAYLARLGGPGLADATRLAVLNANYLRARLRGVYHLPYDTPSLHECVFSDRDLQDFDVHTLDVAKRLLDYGFYAPTIYFPLVVKGALMIEPTETETKETLDQFAVVLRALSLSSQGSARAVDEQYRTFDFARWADLAVAEDRIGLVDRAIRVPRVILLQGYDRIPRRYVRFSRFNIYARDANRCQYCGRQYPRAELNLDHVVPRSRGGTSVWENVVCSCH